ncbi:initiator tRNA phosphoribosyl transferase [Auriscalpium vulgare]|uniref:Initiator tRNA phosphoribosyl transferase n=1 Tax=Auriscalpium vulgare TaxID=40419 RepID=A0ACB8RXF5_9AGAM|nr:initiator tRNA phosphoribosyl transferase [Auriscalpium vulgare]
MDVNGHNFASEARAYLRKESTDLYNRLHSIDEDIIFVDRVREFYASYAFLPNLRCGAWYTDPLHSGLEPAYFKSTDGHYGNWGFNLRRPNLHLLAVAHAHNGLILVDSTRAGKRIPDALSKTVPIWCAVVNRALILRQKADTGTLDSPMYTPPAAVSAQEHRQIEAKLDRWAQELASSSYDLPNLPYPLRPFWITPDTTSFPAIQQRTYIPIICVSASKQVHDGVERREGGFAYVQGSGDDHELWGMGLTPKLFWAHRETLLLSERSGIEDIVKRLVSRTREERVDDTWTTPPTPIARVGGRILVCSIDDMPALLPPPSSADQAFIVIDPVPLPSSESSSNDTQNTTLPSRVLRIYLDPGKKGQYQFLRGVLPRAVQFAAQHLESGADVCIACESGKDASVGVALVLLAEFFDADGALALRKGQRHADKQAVRTRLQWIIASRPQANPSRTTLKRVNEFLLSPRPCEGP